MLDKCYTFIKNVEIYLITPTFIIEPIKIHEVFYNYDGCIINAGAYTHYSYAIHDAIRCVAKPFIEVHISNLCRREEFRHKSVLTPACTGIIAGFGKNSYMLALNAIRELV